MNDLNKASHFREDVANKEFSANEGSAEIFWGDQTIAPRRPKSSVWLRVALAAVAVALMLIDCGLIKAQEGRNQGEHARYWTFAVSPAINGDLKDSGLLFTFSNPCAATAFVVVKGVNRGKSFETDTLSVNTGAQREDNPGSGIVSLPGGVESAETLKISSLTVACGRNSKTWQNPLSGQPHPYCGD